MKPSAGTLYGVQAGNVNAAARYLKLYDKATAPTVGTDVPVQTIIVPGDTAGGGNNVPVPEDGIAFAHGIAFALTTGMADGDPSGVAAGGFVRELAIQVRIGREWVRV